MNEPLLQSDATQEAEARLWDKAPAWRTLTITASLLTLAAVATPLLLPEPAAPVKQVIAANPGKMLLPQPAQAPAPATTAPQASVALANPPAAAPTPAPIHHTAIPTQPLQSQAACHLAPSPTAPRLIGFGTVASFEDHALSMARIQFTEQQSGGLIDPAFIDNPRVVVRNANGMMRVFILPKGMNVRIGDRVMVQDGYRNMALPCNYVPNQIASDLGPAPQQAAPAQAAPITDTLATPQSSSAPQPSATPLP